MVSFSQQRRRFELVVLLAVFLSRQEARRHRRALGAAAGTERSRDQGEARGPARTRRRSGAEGGRGKQAGTAATA
eukprot:6080700-Pleurochrysis_carterae.AAC.2